MIYEGDDMQRTVRLELGKFALQTLLGPDEGDGSQPPPARVIRALHYYLSDRESGRAEWRCPGFSSDSPPEDRVGLELEIDGSIWAAFEQEAGRQGVPTELLATHGVLYYSADRDAGRITQRILDRLDPE
jgi:hypothetical protein